MRRLLIYSLTFWVLLGACSKEEAPAEQSVPAKVKRKPKKMKKVKVPAPALPEAYNPGLGPLRSVAFTELKLQVPKRWRQFGDERMCIFDNEAEEMFLAIWGVKKAPGRNAKSFLQREALQYLRKPKFYRVGERIMTQGGPRVLVRVYDERTMGSYKVVYAEGQGKDRKLRDPRTFAIASVTDRQGHSMILLGLGTNDTYLKLRTTVWEMLKTVR
jgi:hypothetical protein